MKKFIGKIALSAAAVAACAATLGTTTYAWYVSNDNASIGKTTGTTAGAGSQGNLLIADLSIASTGVISRNGSWGANLASLSGVHTPALNPVTQDTAAITPASPTGWHDAENKPVDTANAYGYMAFAVQSTSATNLTLDMGIENTTSGFTSQSLFSSNGAPRTNDATPQSIGIDSNFYMDAVSALRARLYICVFESGSTTVANVLATNAVGTYKTDGWYTTNLTDAYVQVPSAAKSGTGNAQDYYKAVKNVSTIDGGDSEVDGTAVAHQALTVTASKYYIVLVQYWLEGTDVDCFDSCVGQEFKFNYRIKVTPTE